MNSNYCYCRYLSAEGVLQCTQNGKSDASSLIKVALDVSGDNLQISLLISSCNISYGYFYSAEALLMNTHNLIFYGELTIVLVFYHQIIPLILGFCVFKVLCLACHVYEVLSRKLYLYGFRPGRLKSSLLERLARVLKLWK